MAAPRGHLGHKTRQLTPNDTKRGQVQIGSTAVQRHYPPLTTTTVRESAVKGSFLRRPGG